MGAIKILIVEDEVLYANKMEMLVEKLDYEHVGTVDNSTDALEIVTTNPPDLILMDVHIRGSHDGIELAGLINERRTIPIIFVTSMFDDLTFNRASRTNPISFITKPFNEVQLQRTIELTIQQLGQPEPKSSKKEKTWDKDLLFQDSFYIKWRQKLEKIKVEEVSYLKADGHYCEIYVQDKKFVVHSSINELATRLPPNQFIQTHRSYLVNKQKIKSVDLQDSVILIENHQVPLSTRNREKLLKELNWI